MRGKLDAPEVSAHCKGVIEDCLREGFVPFRQRSDQGRSGSSVQEASRRLKIKNQTLSAWVVRQEIRQKDGLPHYLPDWSVWKKPDAVASPAPEPAAELKGDPLEVRRLKDEAAKLRSSLVEAERRAAEAEDLRASVMGLASERLIPTAFPTRQAAGVARAETAILVLSDLHFGEFVSREELDGLNAFDPEIAEARLKRVFQTAASLLTKHWTGPAPDRIILAMLGDAVSGALHPELVRTDKMRPMESVRAVSSVIAGGINLLLRALPCPIDVISVVGNHGRVGLPKPESKGVATESYDTLVSDFLEMHYRNEPRVTFYVPPGPDALVSVYNYRLLFTHGDRLSAGGGRGFVGAELPILRGFQKTHMDYAMRGIILHHIFCGHYHTPLSASIGTANGCLPGPNEYSVSFRMRPTPPMQALVTIHPEHFITQTRWIKPAIPEEGTLYEAPASAAEIKPRYRVKAVSGGSM